MRILFVCTGNSCRSPMAELYLRTLLQRGDNEDVEILSAGLCAATGLPVSRPAEETMRSCGIDASAFRSRRLTPELLDSCDWIVPMTKNQKEVILRASPETEKKVHLLMEFSGSSADVPDPFGGTVEEYGKVFNAMRPALEAMAQRL